MSASPDRQQYLRSPDYYGTAELSAYAREILTRGCNEEMYSKQLTAEWETPTTSLMLYSRNLEQEYPHYQLTASQIDTADKVTYCYMFNENSDSITVYFVTKERTYQPVSYLDPSELPEILMDYMRQYDKSEHVQEPFNSIRTNRLFESIMANIAIDTAIQNEVLDLSKLGPRNSDGTFAINPQAAIATVLQRSVTEGGETFYYTRSARVVTHELSLREPSPESAESSSEQASPDDTM